MDDVDVVGVGFAQEAFDDGLGVVAGFVGGDAAFRVAPDFGDEDVAVAWFVREGLGDVGEAAVGVGAIEEPHAFVPCLAHGVAEVRFAGAPQGIAAVGGLDAGAHSEQGDLDRGEFGGGDRGFGGHGAGAEEHSSAAEGGLLEKGASCGHGVSGFVCWENGLFFIDGFVALVDRELAPWHGEGEDHHGSAVDASGRPAVP